MKASRQQIERQILWIRGLKVMLDHDLAEPYGVPVKVLNQAVKRNARRFPADFMMRLTEEEALRSRSQFVTLKTGGHRKYLPFAFTEQGVAMLSTDLHGEERPKIGFPLALRQSAYNRVVL